MDSTDRRSPGVGGWLLIFCLLLLVWEPASLALLASNLIGDALFRGVAFYGILGARLVIVAVGVAAALAFFNGRPFAAGLAKAAILLSAGMAAFLILTPYFPSNLAPDLKMPVLAGTLAWYAGWYAYLVRSKRVRAFDT